MREKLLEFFYKGIMKGKWQSEVIKFLDKSIFEPSWNVYIKKLKAKIDLRNFFFLDVETNRYCLDTMAYHNFLEIAIFDYTSAFIGNQKIDYKSNEYIEKSLNPGKFFVQFFRKILCWK